MVNMRRRHGEPPAPDILMELMPVTRNACPLCDADPGYACKTPGGRVRGPHEARSTPAPDNECMKCGALPRRMCTSRAGRNRPPHKARLFPDRYAPDPRQEHACVTCGAAPGEPCISADTHSSRGDEETFTRSCSSCNARPGEPCKTHHGDPREPHVAREKPLPGLKVPCPTCDAGAGQRCVSESGRTVQHQHRPRIRAERTLEALL